MMIFVMDVMFIYTTMWTAGSLEAADMNTSQANFYGVNSGVIYLIFFTLFYYVKLLDFLENLNPQQWIITLLVSSASFIVCFFFVKSLFFLLLIVSLAVSFKNY